jgi:hypothetical protein
VDLSLIITDGPAAIFILQALYNGTVISAMIFGVFIVLERVIASLSFRDYERQRQTVIFYFYIYSNCLLITFLNTFLILIIFINF